QAFERCQPVFVVPGAIVRLAAVGSGLQLVRERRRPLLPGEISLRRETHGERKGLRLPWLGENGTTLIAGYGRQRGQSLGIGLQFKRAQGSCPTCQCKRSPVRRRHSPTTLWRQSGLSTNAAAARPDNERWCPGKRICRDVGR